MKRKFIFITTAVVLLSGIITAGVASEWKFAEKLGFISKGARSGNNGELAATYKDRPILMARVNEEILMNDLKEESAKDPDLTVRRATDLIIIKMILREEAEKAGYGPTEQEVRESIELLQKNAERFPEAAAGIASYCEGRGISVDEYWKEVEEQLPGQIARGKFAQHYYEEYYKSNGLDPGALRPEDIEMRNKSYEEYGFSLLKEREKDIVYFE